MGISVEDVKAYITFIKATVGITHEDELIKAVEALTEKITPSRPRKRRTIPNPVAHDCKENSSHAHV